MNKTAIKNFAIWARNKLIADIQYRAGLMGITADGIKDPLPQSTGTMEFYDIGTSEPYAISGEAIPQRKKLVEVIRKKEKDSNYATAYKYILEEVAYTWFNRLIAIRFMEVNDYLPSHIRVLSSESGKIEPDLVTTPFDAELAFTSAEEETVLRLKTENKLDELFRLLFIKQCNALNEILPALFEKTSDYTELLLNLSVVDREGVVYHLTHDIPEQDFDITHPDENGEIQGQVEIIGWLYQYYNTEPKNAAFAKNGKITKEEIPAVTQLFTPDWIVRYMVENSLGRIFIDKRKEQGVYADGRGLDEMSWDEVEAKRIANEEEIAGQMGWKYYLPEAAQTKEVRQQLDEIQKQSEYKDVRDIKVIDPCMGSGHILVYAFDVLMKMYENDGYSQRDAAQSILENNLYGLDIDDRAAQLAYFAVMMKARQYDRRIFTRGIQPHVYAIAESNDIDTFTRDYFANNDPKLKAALDSIMNDLRDAKEYGSILTVAPIDFAALYARAEEVQNDISLYRESALTTILPLIRVAEVLARKYNVIVTNPPYMGSSGMSAKLNDYVKRHYPNSKADMFAVFMEHCHDMAVESGYQAMITQHAWMFIGSYELLREDIYQNDFISLLHLGIKAFEEIGNDVVQTCAFVLQVCNSTKYRTKFVRLVDCKDYHEKENSYLAGKYQTVSCISDYVSIPGKPLAYWVGKNFIQNFDHADFIDKYGTLTGSQNITGDNEKYLRCFWEVSCASVNNRWRFYAKGGDYRQYYGNLTFVVDWSDSARSFYSTNKTSNLLSEEFWYKPGITYSAITSRGTGFRYLPEGCIFDKGGPSIILRNKILEILALLNTNVAKYYFWVFNPSINLQVKDIKNLPIILPNDDTVAKMAEVNLRLCEEDWNAFETSWHFTTHPLVKMRQEDKRQHYTLSGSFAFWKEQCDKNFNELKSNEESLNRLFINLYGLTDEVTPEVEMRDVTIRKAELQREIKSLLSYAVGCMFGRYSLDEEGLILAGQPLNRHFYEGQSPRSGTGVAGAPGMNVPNGQFYYKADGNLKKCSFNPDRDGILPITDEEYLEDDIISRLCDWLKAAYGVDTLEENLDFIAGALGGKGNSSREIIRSYFLKDFFKDHCKTYQKRPIYWLFDSGKQNGFKALIYLHRYTPDTIGNLRVDYLHKMQRVYESEINRMQDMIDHSTNAREVAASTKRKEKLQKQLKECRDYDEMIAHLALSRIELDLDDGVKVNYEKIQTASDGKKYAVLAKI